ncbi:hypothetical protein HDU92_003232 [Lobulomyces angularis]|nr:hypothetical protein HDU92_003232 [Lobulomyces angularis]
MGRTNPVSNRLKNLINWPGDVRHPFISKYIKHIFQHYIVGEPGIRSSTTGIWVNVTVLQLEGMNASNHPKVKKPVLDFSRHRFEESIFGRNELRTKNLLHGVPKVTASGRTMYKTDDKGNPTKEVDRRMHHYYGRLTELKTPPANLLEALGGKEKLVEALGIYRDKPINLKVNVISNPILNANILAKYVASEMGKGISLSRVVIN